MPANLLPNAFPNVSSGSGVGGGAGGSGRAGGSGGGPTTNSPHPPVSSEMNSSAGGSGNLPALPSPLDNKKDVKLLSPSSSGYQGSNATTNAGSSDPLLQGGGLPSLPSIKMEVKEEGVAGSGSGGSGGGGAGHQAGSSSPHPPPSVDTGMPSIRSLPSLDSKMPQNKVMTPPSSGFQESSVASSQGSDPLGGVPSLPESKPPPPPSGGNQKVVPDPSLRKGEKGGVVMWRHAKKE